MTIFRFSLHRKEPDPCNICEQEMLKAISSVEISSPLEYIYRPWSFLLHNNLIHKVWVDLIKGREHRTQGFLGKISESHGINLSWGQ